MTTEAVMDARTVTTEALAWPAKARALLVTNSATYTAAATLLKGIKALRQKIGDVFDSHIQRAHEAHRALVAEKREAEAPLTEAEGILKRALVDYDTAQERIRRAEEQRLQALARQEEETRRLEEAAALEMDGQAEEAATLIEQPIEAPVVMVERSIPKVAGISYRENWSGRVVSLHKLIACVAAHPEHENLLMVNGPALNALARAQKGAMRVDGAEAVCQKIAAASGR